MAMARTAIGVCSLVVSLDLDPDPPLTITTVLELCFSLILYYVHMSHITTMKVTIT